MKAVTGPDTRVVDLQGKMVMPGLVDPHIHALRGVLTSLGFQPLILVKRSDFMTR
jgi:predicted amidohydrolase YtcJ